MEKIKPSQTCLTLGKIRGNYVQLYVFGIKMILWNLCEMIEGMIVNKDLFISINLRLRLFLCLNETINVCNFSWK